MSVIQVGETFWQPPADELPAWVRTGGDVMAWMSEQPGVEPGSQWRSEGPLFDGSRIWIRTA